MDAYDEERRKTWEELEVTRDEFNNFKECLKQDGFRQLLKEYAEEITDPENQKLYQSEITQLEKERGIDVTFVNPEPGYVIKTSLEGNIKCFLNIGKSDRVAKPSSHPGSDTADNGSRPGLNWSIPYVLAPPRDDLDKKNTRCKVFDVVFHPDTLYLATKNSRFRQIVNETALDGVENNFKVSLDRKNVRFPKISFKGVSQPTVIRKPCEKPEEPLDLEPEIYQKLMASYDKHRKMGSFKSGEKNSKRPAPSTKYFKKRDNKTESKDSEYTMPKFIIKHQNLLEMDEFRECKDAKMNSTVPKNLVIEINLPLLKSAGDATLDVQERSLTLKSERPAKYLLELPLAYRVDADKGNAKFDSKLKKLTVTLPVIRTTSIPIDIKEDSGVESDHGSPVSESALMNNLSNKKDESDDSEHSQSPSMCALSDNDDVKSDCADNELRTSEDVNVPFMNPNVKYALPAYTCNLFDDVLAVTIHAKNVESEDIDYKILDDDSGFHILLTSVGAGCFPVYYSLCLKIENDSILPDTISVEPWDNNVVVTVKVRNVEKLSHYFAGLDEDSMEIRNFSIAATIKNKLNVSLEEPEPKTVEDFKVDKNGVVTTLRKQNSSQNTDSDDEEEHECETLSQEEERKSFATSRSVSESSGDELCHGNGDHRQNLKYKGILKSRQFSRSVSESSIDDHNTASSLIAFNDSLHEVNSESEDSNSKKTVRFNDVVSRQLYRSNSSILGQRNKNQRKRKNKKRALERRMSESENSETEDRDKYKVGVKKEAAHDNTQ